MRLFCLALALNAIMPSSASADMTQEDKYTYSYCMTLLELPQSEHASDRMMWKLLFEPMEKSASNIGRSAALFFLHPFCEPRFIGGTGAPFVHLIAENPTNRLTYLEAVKRYFLNTKAQPAVWQAIVNATNTRGMTVLDYTEYLIVNQKSISAEAPGIAAFISFICANGGGYAMFQKRCPPANEDGANGVLARLQHPDKGRQEAAAALLRNQPDTRPLKDRPSY